jgi:CcmD family protein
MTLPTAPPLSRFGRGVGGEGSTTEIFTINRKVPFMSAFVAAYLLVWLAFFGYVIRFDARQRQLAKSIDSLQLRLEEKEDHTVERHAA